MALEAYRSVLRAARIAFQGDSRILSAARVEARSRFNSNRSLSIEDPGTEEKIAEAMEVSRLLRRNIVQGEPVAGQKDRYELRIHPETERGDNDSIKRGTNMGSTVTGCCGNA